MRCWTLLAAAALLATAPAARGDLIMISSSSSVRSEVGDDFGNEFDDSDLFETDVTFSADENTWSQTSLILTNSNTQSVFDFDFTHTRGGTPGLYAKSFADITFTATSDAAFTLSGFYQLYGSNEILYRIGLVDHGIPSLEDPEEKPKEGVPKNGEKKPPIVKGGLNVEHLFGSDDMPDERFELIADPLTGELYTGDGIGKKAARIGVTNDLTGNLLERHLYSFSFEAYIRANSVLDRVGDVFYVDDGGATAAGQLTLTIDQVTSTPEPASFALVGLASLTGLGLRLRRRGTAGTNVAA